MILTIKLDWNWSSFQLANIALPQNVMRCDIAPSARIEVVCVFLGGVAPPCRRGCVLVVTEVQTRQKNASFYFEETNETLHRPLIMRLLGAQSTLKN